MKEKEDNDVQQIEMSITERIWSIVKEVIYVCILIPLLVVVLSIIWQSITEPDKVPHVFGYKLFIVLDGNMCSGIEYGDLVITRNVGEKGELKPNDSIAFRNSYNTVTIHKIINVFEREQQNIETKEMETFEAYEMDIRNSVNAGTHYVKNKSVEGIVIHRIPKIGLILFFVQQPIVMITIYAIIIGIGLICLWIAGKLDERDLKLIEEKRANQSSDEEFDDEFDEYDEDEFEDDEEFDENDECEVDDEDSHEEQKKDEKQNDLNSV